MEQNGLITSASALMETDRKAKYYKLAAAGRKQLQAQKGLQTAFKAGPC
jgi:hypothetical protein